MKVLLLDNYDSFTYNVAHQLEQLGANVVVVRSDADRVEVLLRERYDAIVISPGPGTPDEAGISIDLINAAIEQDIPLLGICLGMQCIAQALGGSISRLQGVVHGTASPVHHDGAGIYVDMPQPFAAGRYHSLVVDEATLPETLVATARTADGVLLGVRHVNRCIEGVQFHPESILTPHGDLLVSAFLAQAAAHR